MNRKSDFEAMDFDGLWLLYEDLTKVLAEKIAAEKLEFDDADTLEVSHSRQPPNAFNLACTRLHVNSNSLALECSIKATKNIRNLKVREAKVSKFRKLASRKKREHWRINASSMISTSNSLLPAFGR
jgi:hypothetical protein